MRHRNTPHHAPTHRPRAAGGDPRRGTAASLVGALLAALALSALSACGDPGSPRPGGDAPTIPAEELAAVPAFPNADELVRTVESIPGAAVAPDGPDAPEVAVPDTLVPTSFTAVGPSGRPTAVQISFNQAMATFEGARPADPSDSASLIAIDPALDGELRWLNDRTLSFTPAGGFPLATRVTATVGPGVVAASGLRLAEPARMTFETERLAVTYAPYGTAQYPTFREPGGDIVVWFNQPVDLDAARSEVEVLVSGSPEALAAGRGARAPFAIAALADEAETRHGFRIIPTGGFTLGTWYRVRIPTSLRGAGPLGLAAPRDVFARGPQRLTVSASCGYEGCYPGSAFHLSFNNALAPGTPADCVRVTPSAAPAEITVEGSYVTVKPARLEVGRVYTVRVDQRCEDVYGSNLAAPFSHRFTIEAPPARVRMSEGVGTLEPTDFGAPIALGATVTATGKITLQRLRVTRETIHALLGGALEEWGGLDLSRFDIDGAITETITPPTEASPLAVPLDDLLGADQRGVVFVQLTTERDGPWGDEVVRRALVQVTDTGLTVKKSAQDALVWATSLATGAPIAGASVWLIGADGEEIWRGETDASGVARVPNDALTGKKPRVALASSGGDDLAFVDLDDWSTRVDPYRFNIPYAWDPAADIVRGFVFTERGIYRAGEKVFVKGFLRYDRGRTLEPPPGRRVEVTVTDALGEALPPIEADLGPLGDFDVALDLSPTASLGTWRIEVRPMVDGEVEGRGYGAFRVEAYRPNRFEVKVEDAVRGDDAVAATVVGRYLHGAPMAGASARWWAHHTSARFAPSAFSAYTFATAPDGMWWEPTETHSGTLASGHGELDDDGRLGIDFGVGELDLSGGPVTVTVEAEVTDVDEQVVASRSRLRVDPAAFYVGVARESSLVAAGAAFEASVVTVAPDGRQVGGAEVTVSLAKRSWESVQKAAAGGGYTWVSERKDDEIAREVVAATADAPATVRFTAPTSGYYLVTARAKDADGREVVASETVWVYGGGDGGWSRSDDERLQIVAERERYAVGETARFLVQSPYPTAHALVTVERQGVIWQRAFPVEGSAPVIEVPITEAMQPNAFVGVALVRGRVPVEDAAEGSDPRPASKFGYAAISVDLSDRVLTVGVAPERATYRPGETVRTTLTLARADGAPTAGRITFFAVDEGVLQLTGYQTPDAIAALYQEQPLSVTTSESRRRLWSRIDPTDDEGDKGDWGGGGDEANVNYRSAFATTAVFLPSVEVGPDGRAEVAFTLPDNLGAFRLMAVAAAEGNRFGRADTRVEVNKPVMVNPALPRFVSAGDVFEARAVVQALTDEGAGEVAIAIATSGPIELLEGSSVTATLRRGKAEAIAFRARATRPGTATFAFKVTRAGAREAADAVQVDIPVQFPASVRAAVESGRVGDEHGVAGLAARRIAVPEWIRDDVGGLGVELAASAVGELVPGLRYLIEYPYGCVEQTTGGTLPLLALSGLSDDFSLPGIDRGQVLVRAQAGVDRLRRMQIYGGGLGYWLGASEAHPWGSAYGGLALVRASKLEGLNVPEATLKDLTRYLRSLLSDEVTPSNDEWAAELQPVKAFAAYVLALAGDADHAFNARLYEARDSLPAFSRALLASAIAEAGGDKAMVDTLVEGLLASVTETGDRAMLRREEGARVYYATMDSDVRNTALVLMTLLRVAPDHPMVAKLARGLLAERRGGRWMSTQDNGFAIIALVAYFAATEKPGESYLATVRLDGEVLFQERFTGGSLATRRVNVPMEALRAAEDGLLTITREGSTAPLLYTLRLDYAPADIPRAAVTRGFTVEREYLFADGPNAGQPATTVPAGALLEVRLAITTGEVRRYVAIDDLLPAGLEPVDTTLDTASGRGGDQGGGSWVFSHVERQDDRVNLFANHMPAGTHRFTYLARATTVGEYLAPAARAHEMYQPDVFGQAPAVAFLVQ